MTRQLEIDEFLTHVGIKGMKWGVRKAEDMSGASDDARRASETQMKINSGGTKVLSNRELKDLVERMNLEQQYSRLVPPTPSQKTKKFLGKILGDIGKQQAAKFVGDFVGKQLGRVLKK